jgi:hypothetical protein
MMSDYETDSRLPRAYKFTSNLIPACSSGDLAIMIETDFSSDLLCNLVELVQLFYDISQCF